MRKSIFVLALFLAACTPTTQPSAGNGTTAKEGELCGGIAGIVCADGLTCKLDGNYPDAAGTCVKQ